MMNLNEPQAKLKQARSSATSSVITGSNIKRMGGSAYENAASTAVEGMALLGQSIKEAQLIPNPPPQTCLDQINVWIF